MHNKKGFTLTELLAVIVILAIIISIGTSATLAILNRNRKISQKEMRDNLKEAALTYTMGKFHLESCSVTFSNELKNGNISNINNAANANCLKKVTVSTLKSNSYFEDNRGYCKDTDEVIIYRYNDGSNTEYRAFANDSVCTN